MPTALKQGFPTALNERVGSRPLSRSGVILAGIVLLLLIAAVAEALLGAWYPPSPDAGMLPAEINLMGP
jgi:hypothetical protein